MSISRIIHTNNEVVADGLMAPIELAEAEQLAELLQAIGDPARLRILTALDSACVPVGVIVAATGLSQSTVSHHLRVLRDRGLVTADRRGSYVYYCCASDDIHPTLDRVRSLLHSRNRP